MAQTLSFKTDQENILNLSLFGGENFGDKPCVIYVHGFKGFKDWGFVPHTAAFLAQEGFSVITFNFSHNGIGPDGETFTELDKFERNTFSLEVSELQEVIRKATRTDFFGAKATSGLGVLGHSRGGGIALLASHLQPEVQAVATWGSVSSFDRVSKEDKQTWKKQGYREVLNSRTGQVFRMGMAMFQDVEKHAKNSLNILKAVKNLERPLLILHGQSDETVPAFEAEQLNIFGNPALTDFRLIPQASHTFNSTHPFSGPSEALSLSLSATSNFFQAHLQ